MRRGPTWMRRLAFVGAAAALIGLPFAAAAAPGIVNSRNFAGQFDITGEPADATIAVGPTRIIQLVNERFAIYTRANTSTTPIASGTLNELVGALGNVRTSKPQMIWDATTNRFYYFMLSVFDGTSTNMQWGWSKTASPSSAADFCQHGFGLGVRLDALSLGDNQHMLMFAFNDFNMTSGAFLGATLATYDKPAAGSACEPFDIGKLGGFYSLLDSENQNLFAPVAANGVDTWVWGYVIARSATLPANAVTLISVRRNPATGDERIGFAKEVTLPFSFDAPPPATQPTLGQLIDTGDASPTQAVIARNPDRGNAFSLWTQHTVKNGAVSAVRWYEINPFPVPPTLRRNGLISAANTFLYNAAISPDRRVDGATTVFGDSFVIQFNRSSAANNIFPQIRMGSSFNGGPPSFATVVNGIGPYRDSTCVFAGDVCKWGDHSGVAPDPRPLTTDRGVVWGTNEFAGSTNTSASQRNWRTRIFAVKP